MDNKSDVEIDESGKECDYCHQRIREIWTLSGYNHAITDALLKLMPDYQEILLLLNGQYCEGCSKKIEKMYEKKAKELRNLQSIERKKEIAELIEGDIECMRHRRISIDLEGIYQESEYLESADEMNRLAEFYSDVMHYAPPNIQEKWIEWFENNSLSEISDALYIDSSRYKKSKEDEDEHEEKEEDNE